MRTSLPRQHELIRRQRRDTLAALESLNAGTLWHPLSEGKYRALLLSDLAAYEQELGAIESDGLEED